MPPSSGKTPDHDVAGLRKQYPDWNVIRSSRNRLWAQRPYGNGEQRRYVTVDADEPGELVERMREREHELGLPNPARPGERA